MTAAAPIFLVYASTSAMVGEVHYHVGSYFPQFVKSLGDVIFSVDADLANHFVAEDTADQLAHGTVGAANNCSHPLIPSFLISS